MPILNVMLSAPQSPEMTRAVTDALMDVTTRILKKRADLISISIRYVDPADWMIGGTSLAQQGKSSFYFDIKITDETNTKVEKANYIREAFCAFERLLGTLHSESYIHVEDVRATAYGYGGLTQEYRYHHPA
jgi:4-oxalocrotonate tautomerase